jgi:hypothetical protein
MITYERQTFGPADLFKDLRDRQVLFDGKIASADPSERSLVLRCHRVVLAAVSRPLEEMFKKIQDPEQIVFIPCVGYNSLNYILKLIYEGSVKVKDDENEAFTASLRSLAIKLGKEIDKRVYCLESPSVPMGLMKTGVRLRCTATFNFKYRNIFSFSDNSVHAKYKERCGSHVSVSRFKRSFSCKCRV